jgi:8-oxo-dGTP pyrophosphatase MutT (NUDIX family)
VELGEEMLVAAAREVAEETTLDQRHLQFYPRCFMTTDAIYNDAAGAVKYHFVISQVRTGTAASRHQPTTTLHHINQQRPTSDTPRHQQMVCWADIHR